MIDEVKAPDWGAKWCQNQGVAFRTGDPSPHYRGEGRSRNASSEEALKEGGFFRLSWCL